MLDTSPVFRKEKDFLHSCAAMRTISWDHVTHASQINPHLGTPHRRGERSVCLVFLLDRSREKNKGLPVWVVGNALADQEVQGGHVVCGLCCGVRRREHCV